MTRVYATQDYDIWSLLLKSVCERLTISMLYEKYIFDPRG